GYLGAGRFLNIDGSTINVTGSSDLQLQAQFGVTITGSNIAPGVNPVNSVGIYGFNGPISISGSVIGGPNVSVVIIYAQAGNNLTIANTSITGNSILLGGNIVTLDPSTVINGSSIEIQANSFLPNGASLSTTPVINPYVP
ncbi:MAG: hypothetical protein SNJ84_04925, partial [Verrucomicrobiia bacterium]